LIWNNLDFEIWISVASGSETRWYSLSSGERRGK